MSLTYVLPLRWQTDEDVSNLTAYLGHIANVAEVIVVDGSPPPLFAAHHDAWSGFCTHVRPDPDLDFQNGKVNGVHTGLRRAGFNHVVIADDDVRYDFANLSRVERLLSDGVDLVRPQNYFDPVPWHAQWDTSRSLVNRAVSRDWPGTVGIRRDTFERAGGYDGDVLFENLELVRTIQTAGGMIASPLDLYVLRRPPTARGFLSQRVRQAYDELARPLVFLFWLAFLPVTVALAAVTPWAPVGVAAGGIVLAEAGRRRSEGIRFFPATASLFAPLWLLERGITTWMSLAMRLGGGGVPYAGSIIRRAATPGRRLRRRLNARPPRTLSPR
jgi:hypothetical protein